MQVTKPIKLDLLAEQLASAGVSVPRGLGLAGTDLYTYDAKGVRAEMPSGAQSVVDAHDATQPSAADLVEAERAAASGDLRSKAQAAVAVLNQTSADMDTILANVDTATLAQTRGGLKLVATDLKALVPLIRALGRSAADQVP